VAQTSQSRSSTSTRSASGSIVLRLRALSPQARWMAVVLVVALVLRLWPIGGYSTDYDEGVYWQSLRSLAQGHALFTQTFSSQPPFFLLSLYPFYVLFGQTLVAARLAVVLYSIIGVIALYFAARATAGPWTGVAAAALLAVDPLYLSESYALQAEVPALAFEIACVAFAATAIQQSGRQRRILACLSGVALGLGVMTKLFDVVALVPAVLYLGQPFFHAFTDDDGQLRRPTRQAVSAHLRTALPDVALFAGGVVVTCVLVLAPFASHWEALYDQAVRFHVVAGQAVNRGLTFNVKLLLGMERSAIVSHHPLGEYPLIVLALVAVVLGIWRRDWRIVPPLLWAVLSFVLLLRQQPLFDHHRVLLSPPLALLGALVVPLASLATSNAHSLSTREQGLRAVSRRTARLATVCILLVVFVSLATSVLDARAGAQSVPDLQRQMALVLRTETLPQDQIVTDDQYIAGLADRTVLPQLVDTSQVRIASGYLTAQQLESIISRADARVILFASGRFDGVPGFREWVRENYIQVADFGGGRALYIRQPSGPPIA
jgi:hypothetical protein